jgi:hypothetical protein
MRDWIFKRKMLVLSMVDAITGVWKWWNDEIKDANLDDRYCCDGYECGCGGQTLRQIWGDVYTR